MDYINTFASNIKYFYSTINPATLTGAIDVIVVEQPEGTLLSTPFYVRFGKYGVFNSSEKYVDIVINNEEIKKLKMKLAEDSIAYFVEEVEDEVDVDEYLASTPNPEAFNDTSSTVKKYVACGMRLSSDQLKAFKLRYGSNEARFSITSRFQGTSWCVCHIYLFKYSEKLVISDIDGTITKSDVLGHVIPAIGGQWAHAGVTELYSRIKMNGYKMVYLSSRAIGQSHYTKTYLQTLAQGSKTLPDGPVLLSPMSVFMALRKEVIERKPEEFKIACLTDLKSLFPVKNPFYAGFGNRETDVRSYSAVEIPAERILIINPSGTVRRADSGGFSSNYSAMAMDMCDFLFPPLGCSPLRSFQDEGTIIKRERMQGNFTKPDTCSTFTYWRTPPTDSLIADDELAAYEAKRKVMADKNNKTKKKSWF